MSRRDDYRDEMFTKRLTDKDVETVLSGQVSDIPELAEIARALGGLDPSRFEDPSEAKAALFAQRAAAVAGAGELERFAATARYRRGLSLTPRLAPAAVAAIIFFSTAGVAVASNGSAPGDVLYPLDRALEEVGIGDGGFEERLEEANALAENGQSTEALAHLSESLENDSGMASDALMQAAERLRLLLAGGENAAEVRAAVAELLEWIATANRHGADFGQQVANQAREIGNRPENPGQSDSAPGQAEDPGQTENRGQSGDNPGQGEDPPGQGGDNPGQGGDPPGQGEDPPGQGEDPPGQGGEPPGQGGDNPGQGGGENKGNQGNAPGQSKD